MTSVLLALLCFAIPGVGAAAEIEWSTNNVSFVGEDGQNSISLKGSLVEAISLGRVDAAPDAAVKVINGGKTEEIEFKQREDVLPSGGFATAPDLKTSDANWNAVIKSADWCSAPNPTTLTLKNLNEGKRYQIELFVYDQRDAGIARRTATFDDGQANKSETIRQDAGVSIIGLFVADGAEQAIKLTQGNAAHPTLNAYILRLID